MAKAVSQSGRTRRRATANPPISVAGYRLDEFPERARATILIFESLTGDEWKSLKRRELSTAEFDATVDLSQILLARRTSTSTEIKLQLTREGAQLSEEWHRRNFMPLLAWLNDASKCEHSPWSEAKSPDDWERVFNVSWKTIKRRWEAGEISLLEHNSKLWSVHNPDLPQQ
jgi:hypothetical protein